MPETMSLFGIPNNERESDLSPLPSPTAILYNAFVVINTIPLIVLVCDSAT